MLDTRAFRTLSYGLYIITAKNADGADAGCIVNTFQQIASKPPRVSVSLNKDNATTKAIEQTGRFCASVLAQSTTMELIGLFGFHSSLEVDKFKGVRCEPHESGIQQVAQDATACFYAEVEKTVDVGSHILFIGEVKDAVVLPSDEPECKPLTYAYYHNVLRRKTPPKAASYAEDEDAGSLPSNVETRNEDGENKAPAAPSMKGKRTGWRCSLCGYIVEMDELPDDFRCPMCGVDKSFFERVELD